LIIWGNHSKSLFVDTHLATLCKRPLHDEVVREKLFEELQTYTQERGAKVIEARGKSSAASAANAALCAMKRLIEPSNGLFSMGVYTKNNPFGLDQDLFFSVPCYLDPNKNLQIASHVKIDAYKQYLKPSLNELLEERETVLKQLK